MVPLTAVRDFLRLEAAGGIVLVATAALAILLANSPLAWLYDGLLETPVAVQIGALSLAKPLLLWINDGMMAVFFFLVGLEIKREFLEGELSSTSQAALPAIGAVGGMVVPIAVFLAFNAGDPLAARGWAIPAATDIAFALGVLALVGARAPAALKLFLLALAIIDDLGAILIIALFYAADLSLLSLGLGLIGLGVLTALNRAGVIRIAPYVLVGIVVWVCVLKSGVHATLAGVAVAFCVPLGDRRGGEASPLKELEHMLHPWVAFGILPVFAFANAGVSLAGLSFADLLAPLPLGIAAGLFLGKQAGVLGFVYGGVRLGWCRLPPGTHWLHFYGVALLTGIGFTMSLFIGTLAFTDGAFAAEVRIGVIGGSILSAALGFAVLRFVAPRAVPATMPAG
ncbi:MAG: Na+/H+ antiporter NhaA [Inquilinus sp.]|nr:Na+/H+ antiporter NhaA [Inquilinus sp.]